MTAYEIITIFIGILALLMSIREIIRRNKNALPVGKQVRLCS